MNNDRDGHIISRRLSYRLLLYIVLSSLVFSLIITVIQLTMTYRSDRTGIEEEITHIGDSYLGPVAASLWSYDMNQMDAQLKGILALPNVKKAVVYEADNGNVRVVQSLGEIGDKKYLERDFVLKHTENKENRVIGGLRIFMGLDAIDAEIRSQAISIFLMRILEISILSFCILIIFQNIIMRHLILISLFLKNLDIDHLDKRLELGRKMNRKADILDIIVWTINQLNQQLSDDIRQRRDVEERLRRTNMELEMNRIDIEEKNRINTYRMAVDDILRHDQSLETLAFRLIQYLCESFNAGVGLFYHVDEIRSVIKVIGSYAMRVDDVVCKEFRPGEGLVGQVFLDREPIQINVPVEHSLTVKSSLGEVCPDHVMIYPFMRDGRVVCMIEIGSFMAISNRQIGLLDQINESVAISIESAVVRAQKSSLLEELNEKIMELGSRDHAFRRSESKFRVLFDGSDHLLVFVEKDGTVAEMNERAKAFLHGGDGTPEGSLKVWDAFPWSRDTVNDLKKMFSEYRETSDTISGKMPERGIAAKFTAEFRRIAVDPDGFSGILMDGVEIPMS
jgi:hypothetical protein